MIPTCLNIRKIDCFRQIQLFCKFTTFWSFDCVVFVVDMQVPISAYAYIIHHVVFQRIWKIVCYLLWHIEALYHFVIQFCDCRRWECYWQVCICWHRHRFNCTYQQRTCWRHFEFYFYCFIRWVVEVEVDHLISHCCQFVQVDLIPCIFTCCQIYSYLIFEVQCRCFFATTCILHIHAKLDLFVCCQF